MNNNPKWMYRVKAYNKQYNLLLDVSHGCQLVHDIEVEGLKERDDVSIIAILNHKTNHTTIITPKYQQLDIWNDNNLEWTLHPLGGVSQKPKPNNHRDREWM